MAIVIFDLDGTLALIEHRRHFVENGNKQWDEFFAACPDDEPNWPVISIYEALRDLGHRMWIFSGRSDVVRDETKAWLSTYGLMPEKLYMRSEGDHQPDDKLKKSWLDGLAGWQKTEILCVFDDRDRIVKMWRDNGLVCLQVAEGNF